MSSTFHDWSAIWICWFLASLSSTVQMTMEMVLGICHLHNLSMRSSVLSAGHSLGCFHCNNSGSCGFHDFIQCEAFNYPASWSSTFQVSISGNFWIIGGIGSMSLPKRTHSFHHLAANKDMVYVSYICNYCFCYEKCVICKLLVQNIFCLRVETDSWN